MPKSRGLGISFVIPFFYFLFWADKLIEELLLNSSITARTYKERETVEETNQRRRGTVEERERESERGLFGNGVGPSKFFFFFCSVFLLVSLFCAAAEIACKIFGN